MINRRQFLGGLSVLGSSFPLLANQKQTLDPKQKAKSVIYIFLDGGLSQFESFNVDFKKEVLAKSNPIKSNADGRRISHYFPNMAKQMDKVLTVNSLITNQGAHPAAIYKALTSYNPRSSITHPELGAWISKFETKPTDSLPNFVAINSRRSGTSGFFPGMYAALPVVNPNQGIQYSKRHHSVGEKNFDKRLDFLRSLDKSFDKENGTKETKAYSDVYQNSVNFMKSKDIEAFDLKKESKNITKLYKKDIFSQSCLLAARLAEKGVKFSKVHLGGWDYHKDLYQDLPKNANMLDNGLSSLLQHLSLKGLLESTLVVVATEFGRTPHINPNAGRDHWPKGFTCLLAGAGVKAGQTYGKMSQDSKEIVEKPVDIIDFNSTIAWSLGVNPEREVMSSSGRPFTIHNKKGKVLKDFFA